MKRTFLQYGLVGILAMSVVMTGCDWNSKPKRIEPRDRSVAAAPAAQEQAPRIMARINGQPIPMNRLYDALVADDGLRVSQQLIADELVRQELLRRNLPTNVTERELEIENRRSLSKLYQFDKSATADQLDGFLSQLLSQRNITRRVWDATMARNVRLARLAENDPRVKVSDEDVRLAFFEEYDGKLQARHIQVPTAVIAQEVMEKARKGEDFGQLAFQYSTNPSGKSGGWLPNIGPRSAPGTIPPTIVQVVRSMKHPGEVSNIVQVGSNFHVLKLEKIIPPSKVKFSEVKGKLRYIVRDKKIDRLQPVIMKELIDQAKIEYVDPVIRSKVKRGTKS